MFRAERCHRARFLEPHPGIELFGKDRLELMAVSLGLGAIDHPDRTLEERHA